MFKNQSKCQQPIWWEDGGDHVSQEETKCYYLHLSSDIAPASKQNGKVTRTTVYENITSMEGYIPSQAQADNLKDMAYLSFREVTGTIRLKLHAIGRLGKVQAL